MFLVFVMLETYISDEGENDVDAYIDDGVVAPARCDR